MTQTDTGTDEKRHGSRKKDVNRPYRINKLMEMTNQVRTCQRSSRSLAQTKLTLKIRPNVLGLYKGGRKNALNAGTPNWGDASSEMSGDALPKMNLSG